MSVFRKPYERYFSFVAALCFAFGVFFAPQAAAHTRVMSERTSGAGSYAVKLKLMPAKSFKKGKSKIVWEGGARPVPLHSRAHPNHDLVAFIKKDGRPVEHADVGILYRRLWPRAQRAWQTLPIARIYAARKGPKSTRFGNNVRLPSGHYDVQVSVNGIWPAVFYLTLHG